VAGAGAGGESDGPLGTSGEGPSGNAAGMPSVTPGDLVCKGDDDCTSPQKPVCDQVLGCVACQYDWDCPANHRCRDNACFEKKPCSDNANCSSDALHPVCDAVQQLCVGCREDADCGEGKRCEASECVAFEACTNSRDCTIGKVCDKLFGACVACVVDGDCGDGSACVKNACVPTCASDKDCLGVGKLCDQSVKRCVECLGHADCPAQYFCGQSNACTLDVCQPGQTRCETQHQLATCSEIGDAFVLASCGADSACVEEGQAASCTPLVCTPDQRSCSDDGAAVVTCSADGLSVASSEPCEQGKACNDGQCVDVVCTPDAASCQGNHLYKCNENGTSEQLVKSCFGQFGSTCDAELGDCRDNVCHPGTPVCDGDVATQCAEDGQGPQPNGTDCAASNDTCFDGECQDVVCTGDFVCSGGVLQRCLNHGTYLQYQSDCAFESLCDAEAGKCITPTCEPGAFVCNGNVATRCKADGSGYVAGGTDCGAKDLACDGGGCLSKVCTPGAAFCAGGNPQKCSTSGAQYVPSDICSSGEYCAEGSQFCLLDKCSANSAVCNGTVVTTCKSDGSGPMPGGTDCAATQQTCEEGACVSVVCTPGALSCEGDAIYRCNDSGTGSSLWEYCSFGTYCDASGETATCATDLCQAGSLGCDGEVISTCGDNGGSWTSPGQNCASDNQVCILGGSCAEEEIAAQAGAYFSETRESSTLYAAFRTLTSRKLTELSFQASIKGLQKVTWLVYEKRVGSSTHDLVYQLVTTRTMPTAGVISSPALDFVFEQGKSYAVGVHVSGPASVAYYYSEPAAASFLTDAGGGYAGGGAQPDTTLVPNNAFYVPYLTFTTTLP
jgi:hypothetical protein